MFTQSRKQRQITQLVTVIISVMVSACLFGVALVLANLNHQKEQGMLRNQTLGKLTSLRANLESELNSAIFINRGLAAQIRVNKGIDGDVFWELAQELYKESPNISSLGLAPNNIVTHVYPLEGNEAALGLKYLENPIQKQAVLRAIETQSSVLDGPLPLVQGGIGIISRTPIFLPSNHNEPEQYWGLISVVINVDHLYERVGLVPDDGKLQIAMRGQEAEGALGNVFFGSSTVFQQSPLTLPITVPGGTWEIAAVPTQGWNQIGEMTWALLGVGFLLSVLLGVLVYGNLANQLKLKELAWSDAVTNLPNRNYFSQFFLSYLKYIERYNHRGAVFVLDLDGFKAVNDTYGHGVGDLALTAVAQRLVSTVRASDLLARIGGDEFWILLVDIRQPQEAAVIAQRIIDSVGEAIHIKDCKIQLGVSIGIAIFPDHGLRQDRLIELADQALYHVKSHGKNNFAFASV